MKAPQFTGRVNERRAVRSLYARAAGGQAQVLLVSGEAGIGKTRLVADLAEHVAGEEYDPARRLLTGRSSPRWLTRPTGCCKTTEPATCLRRGTGCSSRYSRC
jgi:hypothetical protein